MKIAEVVRLSAPQRLLYWIRERQQIYLKRRAGKPKPWTDDEILQRYKFCNVLRINDKVSQWLLNEWYEPFKDHPNMLLACTLARQLNNPESLAAVGFPKVWEPERVQNILEERADIGLKNYSPAYMITSSFGSRSRAPQTKAYQTVHIVCQAVVDRKPRVDPTSMERTWKALDGLPGFSSFIAGQVTADLRWAVSGSWEDRYRWAPMGIGSPRGLNRCHGRPVEQRLTQRQFLEEMLAIYTEARQRPGVPKMEAMDFQSCLCEFDKYERVLHGEGVPRMHYDGGGR